MVEGGRQKFTFSACTQTPPVQLHTALLSSYPCWERLIDLWITKSPDNWTSPNKIILDLNQVLDGPACKTHWGVSKLAEWVQNKFSNDVKIVSKSQFESQQFRAFLSQTIFQIISKSLSELYGHCQPFISHVVLSSFLIPLLNTLCSQCHAEVMPNQVRLKNTV